MSENTDAREYVAIPADPEHPQSSSRNGQENDAEETNLLGHGAISFWAGVAVASGDIIGSGIFASPGVVLSLTRSVGLSLVVWLIGGLLSVVGLMCIIELSVASPSAGGLFTYLQMAFGDRVAFSWQWVNFVTIVPGTLAALAITFGCYLSGFLPGGEGTFEKPNWQVKIIAIVAIFIVTIINCGAPGTGTKLAQVFTTITLCGCFFVFLLGILSVATGNGNPQYEVNFDADTIFADIDWSHVGPALITALWAYSGWADIAAMSEEVVDAKNNLPKLGGLALSVITTAYVVMNVAYLAVLPQDIIEKSTDMGVQFARSIYGPWAGYVVAVCVCTSCFGGVVNCMFLSSRQFYATARAGMFPKILGQVNKQGSPYAAVCITGFLSIILTIPTSFTSVINYVGFALWIYYGLIGVALVVLRVKMPDLERPFKVPMYPVAPLFYAALCIYISINTFIKNPGPCGFSALFLACSLPVHYFSFSLYPRLKAKWASRKSDQLLA